MLTSPLKLACLFMAYLCYFCIINIMWLISYNRGTAYSFGFGQAHLWRIGLPYLSLPYHLPFLLNYLTNSWLTFAFELELILLSSKWAYLYTVTFHLVKVGMLTFGQLTFGLTLGKLTYCQLTFGRLAFGNLDYGKLVQWQLSLGDSKDINRNQLISL